MGIKTNMINLDRHLRTFDHLPKKEVNNVVFSSIICKKIQDP